MCLISIVHYLFVQRKHDCRGSALDLFVDVLALSLNFGQLIVPGILDAVDVGKCGCFNVEPPDDFGEPVHLLVLFDDAIDLVFEPDNAGLTSSAGHGACHIIDAGLK